MGEDGDPSRFVDQADSLLGRELKPFDEGGPALSKIPLEGLGDRPDLPLLHQDPGKVGTSGLASRDRRHLVLRNIESELPELFHDLWVSFPPRSLKNRQFLEKGRSVAVDEET